MCSWFVRFVVNVQEEKMKNLMILAVFLICIGIVFIACTRKGNPAAPKILFENGKWAAEVGTVTTTQPGGTSVLEYLPNGDIRIFNGSGNTNTPFAFSFSQIVDMGPHNRLIIELAAPAEGGWVGAGVTFGNTAGSGNNTIIWWGGTYYSNGVFTLDGIANAPSSGDGIGTADQWLPDRLRGFHLTPLDNDTMIIRKIYVDSAQSVPINIAAIPGLGIPRTGGVPVTNIETAQYSGVVQWSPAMDGDGKFADGVIYTAKITLTPKASFLLRGIPANFFTVSAATSVTYAAGSNTVSVTFPQIGIPYPAPIMFVALTFDDGPTGANTLALLDILDDWDAPVPATWFLGSNMGTPGIALSGDRKTAIDRKLARGDDFGNHAWQHYAWGSSDYTREQMLTDFQQAQNRIIEITGLTPKWFRHPQYSSNDTSLDVIRQMGLACIRNGNNGDPQDWDYSVTAAMLIDRVTDDFALYNGQVFLLHDLPQASTVAALQEIIHILKTKGVGFMTLSQLQAFTGKVVTPGTIVYDFVN
jgi:peptidoglycan/xylan/chitin deacetylase (PgdA/CDA1 family)